MALIDDVKRICDRLANSGWRNLMLRHEIDISQSSARELVRELDKEVTIDTNWPGFEDFISTPGRGIEPGNPAASLLYHAFASTSVHLAPGEKTRMGCLGHPITDFPTVEELDTIENYIFARTHRSLNDVRQFASELLNISCDSIDLAVAVFASEYRPAPETPHQRYADLCLSRTGVARVGTARAIYDGRLRGYVPFRDGDTAHTIRVLPCFYAAWLAVRSGAKEDCFGPARKRVNDAGREFWVPVHKLFNGTECLRETTIQVNLEAYHQNRKIERLHHRLETSGFSSGFSIEDRRRYPFIKEHGLAGWLSVFQGGGLLGPEPQPMVERSSFKGAHLTFQSPPMPSTNFKDDFSPTLTLEAPSVPVRPWPEYAHVRFKLENKNAVYFGNESDAVVQANKGGFRALNISDSTGDGWIKATASGIQELNSIPAYSLVAAPDFFPSVDQREVYEWWERLKDPCSRATQPQWLQQLMDGDFQNVWLREPKPLSDERYAPNINLPDSGFCKGDNTVTAIVSSLQRIDLSKAKPSAPATHRHAALPDAAAGIFAPGWDASVDRTRESESRHFLSTYGLGSPFPEDAKLCAALSTFWPAVAPDTARSYFGLRFPTVCPLTDEENGAVPGSISWDGLRGPWIVAEDSTKSTVRYPRFEHADYTLTALENRFSIALTRRVDLREYTGRILATLRMYRALQSVGNRNTLRILSFRQIASGNLTLKEAQDATGAALSGPFYRFDVFLEESAARLDSRDFEQEDYSVDLIHTLFVGQSDFLLSMVRRGDGSQSRGPWRRINA